MKEETKEFNFQFVFMGGHKFDGKAGIKILEYFKNQLAANHNIVLNDIVIKHDNVLMFRVLE